MAKLEDKALWLLANLLQKLRIQKSDKQQNMPESTNTRMHCNQHFNAWNFLTFMFWLWCRKYTLHWIMMGGIGLFERGTTSQHRFFQPSEVNVCRNGFIFSHCSSSSLPWLSHAAVIESYRTIGQDLFPNKNDTILKV